MAFLCFPCLRAGNRNPITEIHEGFFTWFMWNTGNPGAAGLYAFFAEHIDPSCGAVVCDQQFLADQFEVSTRTIRNRLKYLETNKAIIKIPVAGRVCAYALDPLEVWKGYDTTKEYAAFMTKTLVNKDGDIKRRIMSMFKESEKI